MTERIRAGRSRLYGGGESWCRDSFEKSQEDAAVRMTGWHLARPQRGKPPCLN